MRITWLLLLVCCLCPAASAARCKFSAVFNFGDSNSDTGGFWAAFPAQPGPFGMTYFRKPAGRASDGRLVIDFIVQAMGLPLLSPYLQSIGSDFRHGANFATLASTVMQPTTSLFVSGTSPFYLGVQLNQMKEFRNRVISSGGKNDMRNAKYSFNLTSRKLQKTSSELLTDRGGEATESHRFSPVPVSGKRWNMTVALE